MNSSRKTIPAYATARIESPKPVRGRLAGLDRLDSSANGVVEIIGPLVPDGQFKATPRLPDGVEGIAHSAGKRRGPRVAPAPDGPDDLPGTYVVFYRLDTALEGLRVGALGTFNLPAGFYYYAGSAFGPGGVKARVGRHLTPVKARPKWNIDYLTPHVRALGAFWTHDPIKRECLWSATLATSPGFACPATGFGSHDCGVNRADGFGSPGGRLCEAHLYHSLRPLDVHDFARRLGRLVPGHAPACWRRLDLGK